MYLDHYRLTIKPFDLSPKPDFLWLGEKHKEALATLKYGIVEDMGFLLLTGDVGVGKTALIHRLIRSLDASTLVAHITDPGLGTLDFFRIMAAQFEIPTDFTSKGEFLLALEKFLYQAHKNRKRILLIIDEAQRLNNKLIDQIRVLSNIELSDRKLINIFLVGQPEFKNMLLAEANRPLRQRIAVNYHIDPLSESETGTYIEYRMAVAGASWDIFEPSALREVYRFTSGFPRAINILCDHALLTGYSAGVETIDAAIIRECENELRISKALTPHKTDARQPATPPRWPEIQKRPEPAGPPPQARHQPAPRPRIPMPELEPRRGRSGIYSLIVGACILLTALIGYFWLWPQSSETIQMPTVGETGKADPPFEGQTEPETQTVPPQTAQPERSQANPPARDPATPDSTASESAKPAAGKALANLSPAPAAPDTEPASPPPAEEGLEIADENATDETTTGDGQAIVGRAEASPTPEPPTDNLERSSDLPLPGKSLTAMATLSAALVTEAETDAESTAGGDSAAVQAASPEAQRAATEPVTPPAKETAPAPAVTAPPKPASPAPERKAAPENPPSATQTASTAEAAPRAAAAPQPRPAPDPAPWSTSPADAPASSVAAESANSNAVAAAPAAVPDTKPPSPAKAAPAAQVPPTPETATRSGGAAPVLTVATARPTMTTAKATVEDISMEERLDQFLKRYCNTYTSKDLDAFADLFAAGATENGKPFRSLLPKYEKNFTLIDTIQYRIRMKDFSIEDDQTVTVNGDFFLEWLPPDKRWRENSGEISMRLKDDGSTFLVQRLDYQGNQSKK